MNRSKSYAGLAFAALAFAFSMSVSFQAASTEPDYSNEVHPVTFMPWADRKLAIRTADGQWIGYSNGGVRLQMLIDGNTYRAALKTDPVTGEQKVDVPTLLSALSPRKGSDGGTYFTMRVMQPITLDDGSVIEASTDAQPSEVLLNVDDFYVSKTLQPTEGASQDPTPPSKQADANFNNDLQHNGVTDATRPDAIGPQAADDGQEDVALPAQNDDVDEDDSNDPQALYTPGNAVGMDTYGNPFPQRIFSSPVCSCAGGACGISSGFGSRASFRTRNGRHGSHFHRGLDINTSAHRSGTPVVAAADGCLKIPKKRGRSAQHRRGDPVSIRDLYESGYGYTVRLTHGNGFETQYSHLKSISPAIRWGACFKRGERLGSMGETGNATGPHLHFGVAKDRVLVDPKKYMLGSSGAFFSHSCSDQAEYPELDKEMRDDLRDGQHRQASTVRSSRAVR